MSLGAPPYASASRSAYQLCLGSNTELQTLMHNPRMHRYVYPTPDDAQLSAVDVKGSVFLAWAQMALAAPPFFMQVSRVDIGRDQNREPQCQINMMQVRAYRKQPYKHE